MKIKKYHNKKNIAGMVIKIANRDELLLMEKNKLMIKDFELVAICKILKVDLNILKKYIA